MKSVRKLPDEYMRDHLLDGVQTFDSRPERRYCAFILFNADRKPVGFIMFLLVVQIL